MMAWVTLSWPEPGVLEWTWSDGVVTRSTWLPGDGVQILFPADLLETTVR